MAKIKLTLPGLEIPVNGKQVSFTAPCDCSVVDGIQIDGVDYDVVDSAGNTVSFGKNVWCSGALLTVTLDVDNRKAYLQNQNGFTKAETLTPATASLFGLGTDAVPDDVFELLCNFIPSSYGLMVIRTTDDFGNPVSTVFDMESPDGTTETIITDEAGFYRRYLEKGTYKLTAQTYFHTVSPATSSFQIEHSKPCVVKFTTTKKTSGEIDFEEAANVGVPYWVSSIDLFVVGGGGSGAAAQSRNINRTPVASGGAGGYTSTALGQNIAGEVLSISVGAGGEQVIAAPEDAIDSYLAKNGGDGGKTSIEIDGNEILSALGGKGGLGVTDSDGAGHGVSGGSGSGGVSGYSVGEAGSDGSDGGTVGSAFKEGCGGAGQNTTTRKFAEPDNTLYSGAGGSAGGLYSDETGRVQGVGGAGGGGDGTGTKSSTIKALAALDATTYGGGGGGVALTNETGFGTVVSGAGYQGLASIRWGVAT